MKRGNHHQIVAAAATEVMVVDGVPAQRVKLLPIGSIAMRDNRGPYRIVDAAHAQRIVDATKSWLGGADFNFDYGHSVQRDQAAIAAGWAKADSLNVEADGIYASVEWTEAAGQRIAAREYRYLSPLFLAAKSGEVLQLKNAALVNIGAIDLPAIAAGLSGEDEDMSFALIAAALGLAATATEQECVAAAASLKATVDTAPSTSTIAIAAGLAEAASVEEIAASVTALKSGQVDPTKYVPVEQVTAVNTRLATLEGERAEREVAAAIKGGKLVPALKTWGLNLFKTNEQGWTDFVGAAPVVVAAGTELPAPPGSGAAADTLSAEEVAACAALGMSEEVFLAQKKLDKGAAA
jgi:phage I-like protein